MEVGHPKRCCRFLYPLGVCLVSCPHLTLDGVERLDGFLVIDKPLGITSAAALNTVKRHLPRKHKLGHAGTLDPLATGVLVAMLGKATKLCETVMGQPKGYLAEITLGQTSLTDDKQGPIEARQIDTPPTEEAVRSAVQQFVGTIQQTPPKFSAIKIGGKRACDLMRDGVEFELASRPIEIYRIDVRRFDWPVLELDIDCGRGTYVRSIARDLGEALNTGGFLSQLTRTRVGRFSLEQAVGLKNLSPEVISDRLIPIDSPLGG